MVEDYPYVEVDFRGIAGLVLPEGERWDASSISQKNMTLQKYFSIFIIYALFCSIMRDLIMFFFHHADIGMSFPTRISTFGWCRGVQVVVDPCGGA